MKICGIVAEFNPLHHGHKYIIDTARKETGCDYIVVAMSGDFVQRGEPAIIDKYQRTRMALSCGADAVFVLPSQLSTGSAQYFARGGVALLASIGADTLFFGSESADIDTLKNTDYIKGDIKTPNDILGREYIKAISDLGLNITPLTSARVGTDYHDKTNIYDGFCSASYIRECIMNNSQLSADIMPSECFDILANAITEKKLVIPDDLSDILFTRLLEYNQSGYAAFFDVYSDLSDKISSYLKNYKSFTDYISVLKSKDITYTHISRALLHIALGITNSQIQCIQEHNYVPYARLLGFKHSASQLISYITEHASAPVITNTKAFSETITPSLKNIFDTDINASHIYSYLQNKKTAPFKHEYTQPLIVI